MAVHPLRPATYLRLGEPLPHQLTNRTQSSLLASLFIKASCEALIISSLISRFHLLSQTKRQVLYALLTRPPWLSRCKHRFPIDLHVLSILSAFILSQDQTLHSIYLHIFKFHLISLDVIFFKILDFIDYTLNCFFMLLISLLSVDTFSYRQDIYYHKRKYLSTTFLKFFLIFLKFFNFPYLFPFRYSIFIRY